MKSEFWPVYQDILASQADDPPLPADSPTIFPILTAFGSVVLLPFFPAEPHKLCPQQNSILTTTIDFLSSLLHQEWPWIFALVVAGLFFFFGSTIFSSRRFRLDYIY